MNEQEKANQQIFLLAFENLLLKSEAYELRYQIKKLKSDKSRLLRTLNNLRKISDN